MLAYLTDYPYEAYYLHVIVHDSGRKSQKRRDRRSNGRAFNFVSGLLPRIRLLNGSRQIRQDVAKPCRRCRRT